MGLDVATVLICCLFFGAALLIFSWSLAFGASSARWRMDWAVGNTAVFLGVSLFLTQGTFPPWASVFLANGLILLGYHWLEKGLRGLAHKPFRRTTVVLVAGLFLGTFVPFTFVWNLYEPRLVVYTLLVMAVWFRMFLLLAGLPERRGHPILVHAAMVLCAIILSIQGLRALVTLLGVAPSQGLALMLLLTTGLLVAWGLSFISLDMLRSRTELERALETRDKVMKLVAHDLRGPIGSQVSLLELLQESGQCRDEGDEMLQAVTTSSRHSFELLENLLDWGQHQRGDLAVRWEELSPAVYFAQAWEPYDLAAQAKGVTAKIAVDAQARCRSDRRVLAAILRNLVSNAVKFSPPGGVVTMDFAPTATGVEFRVHNQGPRIPPDLLEALNQNESVESRPGTAGERGSGLGLALCRDMASLQRGRILVSSDDHGTTARLVLPDPVEKNQKTFREPKGGRG